MQLYGLFFVPTTFASWRVHQHALSGAHWDPIFRHELGLYIIINKTVLRACAYSGARCSTGRATRKTNNSLSVRSSGAEVERRAARFLRNAWGLDRFFLKKRKKDWYRMVEVCKIAVTLQHVNVRGGCRLIKTRENERKRNCLSHWQAWQHVTGIGTHIR